MKVQTHFSDFFDVKPRLLAQYGAFNVSLINDLPLFIDPFLLFNSSNPTYRKLHDDIIRYVRFLRDKSLAGRIDPGLLKAWFMFGEIKQSWLGYSMVGNRGTGLGQDFAAALNANLVSVFSNFGQESITLGSHLEKLCLISDRVGRDNISDFTTNLIKEFLLDYTQAFAQQFIDPGLRRTYVVEKVRFNYQTESWERATYDLPSFNGDYVLLTPFDILTKDEIWINKNDLLNNYDVIANSVDNDQLRAQFNNYLVSVLPPNPKLKEIREAVSLALRRFPEFVEYYIRYKEDNGDEAKHISTEKVEEVRQVFVEQVATAVISLAGRTSFYEIPGDTYTEAQERVSFLKQFIENMDGYRLFYYEGRPVKREQDVQLLFRLAWYSTPSDVNREVNNGRGPVDYKISRGSSDQSLVEFKLASNTQLERNLANQVKVYEAANQTHKSLKVILYFSEQERRKVDGILHNLGLENDSSIVLIDARADNKPSASKV